MPHGGVMTETVRIGKDERNISVCANCGSPHNLKICSGAGRGGWGWGRALGACEHTEAGVPVLSCSD